MQVFDQDRVLKIGAIMPKFNEVAQPGDSVLMGLEGDPKFPYTASNRPSATIETITRNNTGTEIRLKLSNGTYKTVNEYSVGPADVWEYSDHAFQQVFERERNKVQPKQSHTSRSESALAESGSKSLQAQISQLRSELESERQMTRNFHTTYVASLHELASDVCKLDTSGKHASFCRTFNNEYDKMQNRGEKSLYRGVGGGKMAYDNDQNKQQDYADSFTESEADSLSDAEDLQALNESDYF